MSEFLKTFSDPQAVARYVEGPPRVVPGFFDLHKMTTVLLTEHAPEEAHILVLGAGGGLELRSMAQARPGWRFTGVDPAGEMLKLAATTLGEAASRVTFQEGYIDAAPAGPFDGGVCLLTLHFLPREARVRAATEVRRRVQPGAPFVVAHSSFPQDINERDTWLSRYAAFAVTSGVDQADADKMSVAVAASLDLLEPEQDEAVLREAGFVNVQQFYAAFTWRGWVGYA